jgi:hypothetical protein
MAVRTEAPHLPRRLPGHFDPVALNLSDDHGDVNSQLRSEAVNLLEGAGRPVVINQVSQPDFDGLGDAAGHALLDPSGLKVTAP